MTQEITTSTLKPFMTSAFDGFRKNFLRYHVDRIEPYSCVYEANWGVVYPRNFRDSDQIITVLSTSLGVVGGEICKVEIPWTNTYMVGVFVSLFEAGALVLAGRNPKTVQCEHFPAICARPSEAAT